MYYKDSNNLVYFYDDPALVKSGLVSITDAEALGLIEVRNVPTSNENKVTAISLLKETDWTELPSVTSPESTPKLMNAEEFASYRTQIRVIAVTPQSGDVSWPEKPQALWSW